MSHVIYYDGGHFHVHCLTFIVLVSFGYEATSLLNFSGHSAE